MPVDQDVLSALAREFTERMTSIRGRRVQRLLKREFAGAEYVFLAHSEFGNAVVLGLSATGAATCATDGRGKHASVLKWHHGSAEAFECQFDLHKDSLPLLVAAAVPLARLGLRVPEQAVPGQAQPLVAKAMLVLA